MKRKLVLGVIFGLIFAASSAFAADREQPHSQGPSLAQRAQKGFFLHHALSSKRAHSDPLAFLEKVGCTANCGGGGSVSCSGEICVAIGGTGVGCGDAATDENDVIITCN